MDEVSDEWSALEANPQRKCILAEIDDSPLVPGSPAHSPVPLRVEGLGLRRVNSRIQ